MRPELGQRKEKKDDKGRREEKRGKGQENKVLWDRSSKNLSDM